MPQRKIFTADVLERLAANGRATRAAQRAGEPMPDHAPVVKVFNPFGSATWLLTELDPDDEDGLFGLCDLGFGFPELGRVLRSDIEQCRIRRGRYELPLERDKWFRGEHPISAYIATARAAGRIIDYPKPATTDTGWRDRPATTNP
jgi:hypothetical protein